MKFTPKDGAIFVRTKSSGDWLTVEVSDTGPGIEPEKLSRVFDAFEQATPGSSTGLGLGLAICKALVELHGGTIRAQSLGPSTGASFVVNLPNCDGAQQAKPTHSIATVPMGTIRILLVDDHTDTTESLRLLLTQQGHQVRTATSIAQALEVAKSCEFDVVVSDIGLPDGAGTELLQRLTSGRNCPIPAIAMSGFGMEDDLERSRKAGFALHLTKPVEFATLYQAIMRLAGER